ncbi:carboxy terminal-processing peptidase [Urechidicola vernalis]|uniref:Carboxy terminal-processing peptidase n=1 Tax=Urechidicola vernalis TaxID=3075600 RepID=A0ABU2Y4T4_9FLAO|nr:carboxy terminal-processing peptidase [Urechidicola sp. P050]MDT0553204.1 carboxy terminal-processing peptidase [Urechidicola sp. P050]
MRRNLKFLLPIILAALTLVSFNHNSVTSDEKDKVLINLLRHILSSGHYVEQDINDAFSEVVYSSFIESLDSGKRYFIQDDLNEFSAYKTLIDDQILTEDMTFFNLVYNRFMLRVEEAKSFYPEILNQPYDFTKNETLSVDYESNSFAIDKNQLYDNWRKQLKFSTLSRIHDKLSDKEGETEDGTMLTSVQLNDANFEAIEKNAREKTKEYYDEFYDRMSDFDHTDWFASYLNSITGAFDPHTTYFPPRNKKQFEEQLSGRIEGIGARLYQKNDYIYVSELVPGGPAWRAGELEAEDVILKVAQGKEEPLDVVGMRLDKAIEFIKGKKGTEVRLTLKKIDGSIETISIVRDVIELAETFVKSSIIEKDNKKYGVINLPAFYIDYNDRNGRNCAEDMAQEIEKLKSENIDGILIDLRNNGGGSLPAVIEMAGLFIEDGPIVQVKYKNDEPIVHKDRSQSILWDGPMVVLTNEFSASASEIFAAAMQDYNRAVILGSKQTFGKGTVQSIVDLNRYKYPEDLGGLKMTIQKYYRINGGSVQLEGVKPDVILPSRYTYMDIGEKDYDNALPWDQIKKATYDKWGYYSNFDEVVGNSISRINDNSQFLLIDENAKWLKEGQDDNTIYLNYDKYKYDLDSRSEEGKRFKKLTEYTTDLTFKSPQYETTLIANDSVLGQKRVAWHKNLSKDIYIEEGLNVLDELKIKKEVELVKN